MGKILWRWKPGARGAGYNKFHIMNMKWPIFADTMLFHYPIGGGRIPHRDPLPAKRKDWSHYRFNIELWKSGDGGEFIMHEGKPVFKFWRFVLFRADLYTHEVTTVTRGCRYVLSIGWSLSPKKANA
jgi:hypothetical protein